LTPRSLPALSSVSTHACAPTLTSSPLPPLQDEELEHIERELQEIERAEKELVAIKRIQRVERGRKGRSRAKSQMLGRKREVDERFEEEQYREKMRQRRQQRAQETEGTEPPPTAGSARSRHSRRGRDGDDSWPPYRERGGTESEWRRHRDKREHEAAASIQRLARGRASRNTYRRRIDSRLDIRRGLEARKARERELLEREEEEEEAGERRVKREAQARKAAGHQKVEARKAAALKTVEDAEAAATRTMASDLYGGGEVSGVGVSRPERDRLEVLARESYNRTLAKEKAKTAKKTDKKKEKKPPERFSRSLKSGFGGSMAALGEGEESQESSAGPSHPEYQAREEGLPYGAPPQGEVDEEESAGSYSESGFEEESVSELHEEDQEREQAERRRLQDARAKQIRVSRARGLLKATCEVMWVHTLKTQLDGERGAVVTWKEAQRKAKAEAKSARSRQLAAVWRGVELIRLAVASLRSDEAQMAILTGLLQWKLHARLAGVMTRVNRSWLSRAHREVEVSCFTSLRLAWREAKRNDADEAMKKVMNKMEESKQVVPSWADLLAAQGPAPEEEITAPIPAAASSASNPKVHRSYREIGGIKAAASPAAGHGGLLSPRAPAFTGTVTDWLGSVSSKLAAYGDVFEAEGFDSAEAVACMAPEDMVTLGVKLGHRRILEVAVQRLKAGGQGEEEPVAAVVVAARSPSQGERSQGKGKSPSLEPPSYETIVPLEPPNEEDNSDGEAPPKSSRSHKSVLSPPGGERGRGPPKTVRFAPHVDSVETEEDEEDSEEDRLGKGEKLPYVEAMWRPTAAGAIPSTVKLLELLEGCDFPVPEFHLVAPSMAVRSWNFLKGQVQYRENYALTQKDRLKLCKRMLSRKEPTGRPASGVRRDRSKAVCAEYLASNRQPAASAIPRSEPLSEPDLRHFCDKRWSGAHGILRSLPCDEVGSLITATWEGEMVLHVEVWPPQGRSQGASREAGDEDAVSAPMHEAVETLGITLFEALQEALKPSPGRLCLALDYQPRSNTLHLIGCLGLSVASPKKPVARIEELSPPRRSRPRESAGRSRSAMAGSVSYPVGAPSIRGGDLPGSEEMAHITRALDERADRIRMKNKAAEERRAKSEAKARHYAVIKAQELHEKRRVPKWAKKEQAAAARREKARRRRRREESDDEEEESEEDTRRGPRSRSAADLISQAYGVSSSNVRSWAMGAPGGNITANGYSREEEGMGLPRHKKANERGKSAARRGSVSYRRGSVVSEEDRGGGGGGLLPPVVDNETRKLLREREMLRAKYEKEAVEAEAEKEASRLRDELQSEIEAWKDRIDEIQMERPKSTASNYSSMRHRELSEEKPWRAGSKHNTPVRRKQPEERAGSMPRRREGSSRRVARRGSEESVTDLESREEEEEDEEEEEEEQANRGEDALARLTGGGHKGQSGIRIDSQRRGRYVSMREMQGRLAPNTDPLPKKKVRGGSFAKEKRSPSKSIGKSASPPTGKVKVPTAMDIAAARANPLAGEEVGEKAIDHRSHPYDALVNLEKKIQDAITREAENILHDEVRRAELLTRSPKLAKKTTGSSKPHTMDVAPVVAAAPAVAAAAAAAAGDASHRSHQSNQSRRSQNAATRALVAAEAALETGGGGRPAAIDTGGEKKKRVVISPNVEYIDEPVYIDPEEIELDDDAEDPSAASGKPEATMSMSEIEKLITSLSAPVDLTGGEKSPSKLEVAWCSRVDCDRHCHPGLDLCYPHHRQSHKAPKHGFKPQSTSPASAGDGREDELAATLRLEDDEGANSRPDQPHMPAPLRRD